MTGRVLLRTLTGLLVQLSKKQHILDQSVALTGMSGGQSYSLSFQEPSLPE